ncbi:THUMP domain-containing protein 2 [Melanotaenia boesemani]|uniref:THUMP domain-containing protein 2 n=1 Tax=Melanotaenia boesemani TaxID=1250792 RepID=UPI001C044B75|nr:THUMP domain-containing protein 2 [Melanotaenia boesemani]XP_041865930.1 THUMP domain-containing protein 2 [Melanotaenia boesemani]
MEEPMCIRSMVRYYCTAGNGMENFLIEEVKKKLAAENVCQIPGKVLFSSPATIEKISGLKAAERLFLLLKQDSPLRPSAHTTPAKAASMLQSKLLAERYQWTSAVMTWSRLQGELAANSNAVKTPNTTQGLKKEREEEKGKKEQCLVDPQKQRCTLKEEERENKRSRSCEPNEILTPVKKRNTDEDGNNVWKEEPPETDRRREEEAAMALEFSSYRKNGTNLISSRFVSENTTQELEHIVESSSRAVDEMGENKASENVENISFRISCKCNGSLSRFLCAQEVSKVMGAGVSKLLGWKVDLKNPQLEINVYLSDDYCLLGIPLTRLPLANRTYIKTTGLRSTVAWAMASLAQIQPGFCVVDPMCGVGTILIEAAQEHKAACFLGVDIDDGQLQRASENIAYAELGNRIQLLKASSMALPLPSASVDAVICDLPFGRKFSSRTNMAANLPLILSEMERVLCLGGTLVALLSPQLSCLLKKLLIQKHTEPTSNQEAKFQSGIQNCLSSESSAEQQTFQIHPGVGCSHTQERAPQHSLRPPLSSLKHQTTVRVSLGAIDGLIHKYVKTDI